MRLPERAERSSFASGRLRLLCMRRRSPENGVTVRAMPLAPGPSEFQNLLLAPKILSDPRGPIMELTARYGRIWRSRTV